MDSTKVLALAESYIAARGWPSRDRASAWLAAVLGNAMTWARRAEAPRCADTTDPVVEALGNLLHALPNDMRERVVAMRHAAVLAEREACARAAIADGAAAAAVFDMRGACAGERIATAIRSRRG